MANNCHYPTNCEIMQRVVRTVMYIPIMSLMGIGFVPGTFIVCLLHSHIHIAPTQPSIYTAGYNFISIQWIRR